MEKLLIIFPGAYVIGLIGVPPLLLGLITDSCSLTAVTFVVHTVSLLTIPGYLFIWRVLSYGGRVL
jgi:hypothetical protein